MASSLELARLEISFSCPTVAFFVTLFSKEDILLLVCLMIRETFFKGTDNFVILEMEN